MEMHGGNHGNQHTGGKVSQRNLADMGTILGGNTTLPPGSQTKLSDMGITGNQYARSHDVTKLSDMGITGKQSPHRRQRLKHPIHRPELHQATARHADDGTAVIIP